jgi:hypothetical protein
MEFRRPLFYFTLPGLFLEVIGLYLGAQFVQAFATGGRLNFGPTMLMVLLIVVGSFMALTGILLHSLASILVTIQPPKDN